MGLASSSSMRSAGHPARLASRAQPHLHSAPGPGCRGPLQDALGASGFDMEEFNSLLSELTADLLKPPSSVPPDEPGLRVDVANSGWLKQARRARLRGA